MPGHMAMRDVLPMSWSDEAAGPMVGGVALAELAAEHGTPLYVVDEEHLRARFTDFRKAFGADTQLAYAAKAFFCVALAEMLAGEGWWVDAVSEGEIKTALEGRMAPSRILFHGNYKTDAELGMALDEGVGRIIVDDPSEIGRINAADRSVAVLLRLNLDVAADTHPHIRTTGADVHFGMSVDAADAAIAAAVDGPVNLRGVHVHIGSQIGDPHRYHDAAIAALDFIDERRQVFGDRPELDLGGGMAAPYRADDRLIALEDYADAIRSAIGDAQVRLFVEPGRRVIANAGLSLYTVGVRKEAEPPFLAVDGGISDNPRPALYGATYEAVSLSRRGEEAPFRIVGRHCETGDRITQARLPRDTGPGDLIAIPATGAYGFSMASRYNMLPRRPVVFVGDGSARVAVAGETLGDVVR